MVLSDALMWLAQAAPLVQQTADSVRVVVDTPVVKMVTASPTAFERISGVASGMVSITLLVLTVALVPAAWNFRKSYKKVNELLDRVYGDINPLMRHASAIADDVNYITTAVRVDVQEVNRTVAAANERVRAAMDEAERQLRELRAFLAVVQAEAEDTFVTTASTVRGVRAGAEAFGAGRRDTELSLLDAEAIAAAAREAADEMEETIDGDDGSNARPDAGRPGPRLKPRR
jgi:uncharacterized protein YoxC